MQFEPEQWLSPNSCSGNYSELPKGCGVYLLVRATWHPKLTHEVLYVGMSTNVAKRIENHEIKALLDQMDGDWDYVQVYFKRVPKERLRERERKLIRAFNPKFNLQHRVRGM